MREILSPREGNRALQQAYSTVIFPLRKGSRAPQHAGNTLTQEREQGPTACGKNSHSGKGIGPHSMREILSLRKGNRAPQHAGNTFTQGRE
jgi:hypothetical protein